MLYLTLPVPSILQPQITDHVKYLALIHKNIWHDYAPDLDATLMFVVVSSNCDSVSQVTMAGLLGHVPDCSLPLQVTMSSIMLPVAVLPVAVHLAN